MAKPTLKQGPATAYEAPNELIREFGDRKGHGGLLSIRILESGEMVIELYQTNGEITVHLDANCHLGERAAGPTPVQP